MSSSNVLSIKWEMSYKVHGVWKIVFYNNVKKNSYFCTGIQEGKGEWSQHWKEVKNEERGKREAADQVQRRLETDKWRSGKFSVVGMA